MNSSSLPVPENSTGAETNTEESIELENADAARKIFMIAKERLLSVNQWHKLAGKASADFQLTDSKGNEVDRAARIGDHFKIDLPAPGSKTGEGHDWVKIEAMEENENMVMIRVRPATNPCNEMEDVAHFFSSEASSSFMVRREDNKIIAGVYGRNEKPNTDTETVTDKIRNAAVAVGAISGFAKLQWKSLVKGIVDI